MTLTPTVPSQSTVAAWSAAQVGCCQARDEDAALFNDWVGHGGHWNGDWSGYCTRFVWTAWFRAGVDIWAAKHATQMFVRFASVLRSGDAPVGAILFWPDFAAAGHVAIADGKGWMYTAVGGYAENRPIAHSPITDMGPGLAGWALPPWHYE